MSESNILHAARAVLSNWESGDLAGAVRQLDFAITVHDGAEIDNHVKDGDTTLADHAEMWTEENGETVPARDTAEWNVMYKRWIDFAFENIEAT